MELLPNNCRFSGFAVFPADYEKCKPSALNVKWYISYRFYDDNTRETKQVKIRNFNRLHTLKERRASIKERLNAEREALFENGYNPIHDTYTTPIVAEKEGDIGKYTPVMTALRFASTMLKNVGPDSMKKEVNPVLGYIAKACKDLGYEKTGIWNIGLKNLYLICEKAGIRKDGTPSADKFNRVVKVLDWLYKVLVKFEVVKVNFALSIEKQKKGLKEKKEPITIDERRIIDQYFRAHQPSSWLYVRIFWHSGARTTELLKVQRKHVDLNSRVVSYIVLKGNAPAYKERPILDVALEFWNMACEGAKPDDYIFGQGLKASSTPTDPQIVKQRWQRMCEKTGINKGMYLLKHTHTTGVKKHIGTKGAAMLNAESEDMIRQVYDLDHEKDEMDSIRGVNVPFV